MKLPSPTGWSPRTIAALLRGSLPPARPAAPDPGRTAAEPIIPWRGDSCEPRPVRPMLGGADAVRRMPYAPEDDAGFDRPRRPLRATGGRGAQHFPWEELARLRGVLDGDPGVQGDARAIHSHPSARPISMAPHAPPADPRGALLAPGTVSHTATTLGWSLTTPGGRRPSRAVPGTHRRTGVWRWALWIVAVAAALRYLGAL